MNNGFKVQYFTTSTANPISEFLDSLSEREQTKVLRIFQKIETYGLVAILPHTKKLSGSPLWEIRILGNDSIRIIYVIPQEKTILVLHAFIKKSQKTPPKELDTALRRLAEFNERLKLDK